MLGKQKLKALQKKRQSGMGRMLLLARKDFIERLSQAMCDRRVELPRSSVTLLPFIDLEGTRSTEIARRMGVSKQAAAKAVKALEGTGLIARAPDATDARAFRVCFTEEGLRFMIKLHDAIDQVEQDYARLLGAARIEALSSALFVIAYKDKPALADAAGV